MFKVGLEIRIGISLTNIESEQKYGMQNHSSIETVRINSKAKRKENRRPVMTEMYENKARET